MDNWKSALKIEPATPGHDAGAGEATRARRAWPWEPDQSVAVNLAVGSLQKFFVKSLAKGNSLQVETLFSTVGALTGFAAQHAVRQECLASGRAEAEVLVTVETAGGERFYFGDRLNAILVPSRVDDLTVWSVVAGEAMRLGAAKGDLPDGMQIFERVAKSVGTPGFGIPQVPAG